MFIDSCVEEVTDPNVHRAYLYPRLHCQDHQQPYRYHPGIFLQDRQTAIQGSGFSRLERLERHLESVGYFRQDYQDSDDKAERQWRG